MNSLHSTLDALNLHYIGIGGLFSVVNNFWTLVALVTAAVSFWCLRGAALLLHLPDPSRRVGSLHERESTSESICSGIRETAAVPSVSLDTKTAATPLACSDGATKGKFVAYFREDEECDVAAAVEEEEEEEEEVVDRSVSGAWWEGWEKAWRMRRKGAEMGTGGWYDYQDLEVLNGSVVRLWEVETSTVTSPLRQSMRCIVW